MVRGQLQNSSSYTLLHGHGSSECNLFCSLSRSGLMTILRSNCSHLDCHFTAFLFKVNPQTPFIYSLSSAIKGKAVLQWRGRNDRGGLSSSQISHFYVNLLHSLMLLLCVVIILINTTQSNQYQYQSLFFSKQQK